MYHLGTVRPGSTIQLAFGSFAGSTGAPSATTNFAAADIQVYKDGSTTQRASSAGITVTADFDTLTGANTVSIDLADNTTAGFWAAGSRYVVFVSDVTIDSQTMRFPLCAFTIGLQGAVLSTTIATLSTQTSFTLTAGPAEDNALVGAVAYIHDVASAVQGAFAVVTGYTGSTKTVTLAAAPTFTIAASDNIMLMPPSNTTHVAGTAQTARDIGASVLLSNGTGTGQVSLTSGRVNADVTHIATAAVSTSTAQIGVNVVNFGGSAGTFASGRPEVNTTHAAGTAWGSGAITAASLAADAITAAKVADDVSTEFRTKAMALTTCSGVVGSGSTTANVVASSVAVGATTSISADAWKGRVIIFNSDTTTAALRGQAAVIVSHTSGTTPTFTLATGAWTTAPLSGDAFTVV